MKKRHLSILLSIFLILPNVISAAASEQDFYPNAAYSIRDDLGENGKWKYRELFVHTTCDDITQIPAASDYADMKVASDDTRTYFEKAAARYKKIGVEVEELHPNVDYAFSGYVKSDVDCGACMLGGVYVVFDADGTRLSSGANDMSVTSFASKPEWQEIKKTLRFTQYKDKIDGKIYDIPEGGFIANEAEWRKEIFITHGLADTTVTFGIDDVSLRQIPAADQCIAYTKNASTQENPTISTTDEISFTFSNEIDMRTVTPKSVLLNGAAYDSTEIRATVDDETRETTIYIKFKVLGSEQSYHVELSGIKDAWNRDIVGTNQTIFTTLPAVEQKDITFIDSEKQTITSLAPGSIVPSITLRSNIGDINANIIVTECDGNKIVELQYLPVTLTSTERLYTLPALNIDSADHDIRVYVWSDSDYPTPYVKCGIFSKNGYTNAKY